ncbi:MAG: type VI secretion system-associated FHA domain protein TagH [Gammaproteobacteria bacterium]
MSLRLQIVSRHRQSLGERGMREFGHSGGTIGRSLESDWVLPDGQRYLSSRHASIDYRSGSYYVVDSSTNGVYVNDAEQPVGRGNPQRLFTGDRLRIGEYEMQVEILGEDNTGAQFTGTHEDPVSKAQRVPPPDPTRADLLPGHEITAVGIEWMIDEEADQSDARKAAKQHAANGANLTLAEYPPPKPKARPHVEVSADPPPIRPAPPTVSAAAHIKATRKPPPNPPPKPKGPVPKSKASPATPAVSSARPAERSAPPKGEPAASAATARPTASAAATGSAVALDAFFRGAGLPALKLDDKQTEQTLHRLGQIMREVILGVSENLHLRADQKNALRVPTTTIQPQRNNPLKFSASVEEALTNLLFRQSGEYLGAIEAVRETFGDIKQHQQHLLAAMRTAVSDYIGRLDPEDLESKFSNGKRGIMNAANKLKYWDLFKDLYQVVANGQPGQLPQQFLEDLTRAYENEDSRAAPRSVAKGSNTKLA